MIFKPQPYYRLKVIFVFLMVKLKFLQAFLSEKVREELPVGWNNHMFWVAFTSNGQKFFYDRYIKLKKPASYTPNVSVEEKYRLSEEDIKHFYVNGFVKPFKVIKPHEAENMRLHLVDLVRNKTSKVHPRGTYEFEESDNKLNNEETTDVTKEFVHDRLKGRNRHLDDAQLLDLFKSPEIIERCAQLLGEDLLLWRSVFFPVAPKSDGTEWHQASTWLLNDWKENTLTPPNVEEIFQVTIWIALTDTTMDRACLTTVSNSQWEIHPSKFKLDSKKASVIHGEYQAEVDYDIKPKDINYIEMKAGECIIFSERVLHGSTDNVTDKWRWGVNARLVKTETKVYTERMLREGSGLKSLGMKNLDLKNWRAVLVRGKDDYGHNRLLKEEELKTLKEYSAV